MPSSQVPLPAACSSRVPLWPSPELELVQKGMTVLPLKSLAETKLLTGQAAMTSALKNTLKAMGFQLLNGHNLSGMKFRLIN